MKKNIAVFSLFVCLVYLVFIKVSAFQYRKDSLIDSFVQVNGSSGFVIKKIAGENKCYILTAYHVVNNDKVTSIIYERERRGIFISSIKLLGTIIEYDEAIDYAIIEVPYFNCKEVSIELQFHLQDEVVSIGRPQSTMWISRGIVSRIFETKIGHTAGIHYGSSGGPLFNSNYRVIGVNVGVKGFRPDIKKQDIKIPIEFMGYAVKIKDILDDLGPEKTKKYFGVN